MPGRLIAEAATEYEPPGRGVVWPGPVEPRARDGSDGTDGKDELMPKPMPGAELEPTRDRIFERSASVAPLCWSSETTALMRAAFAGDLELVKLLLAAGADPHLQSKDRETTLMAAAGTGFINGYNRGRPAAERLEVVKLLVGLGENVNAADNYGITPLMVAANMGEVPIVQYLIDQGADLGAYDLGKKNDGQFGSSIEPLMPIDYAIGVGTFVPNNAVIYHEEAVKLMSRLMQERGIKHTTSECTLRGFTCSLANVDPKTATPAEIQKVRKIQTGNQVDGVTGGLAVKDPEKNPK